MHSEQPTLMITCTAMALCNPFSRVVSVHTNETLLGPTQDHLKLTSLFPYTMGRIVRFYEPEKKR
jgi:hypothetical protein